jgi:hypothetical protein
MPPGGNQSPLPPSAASFAIDHSSSRVIFFFFFFNATHQQHAPFAILQEIAKSYAELTSGAVNAGDTWIASVEAGSVLVEAVTQLRTPALAARFAANLTAFLTTRLQQDTFFKPFGKGYS